MTERKAPGRGLVVDASVSLAWLFEDEATKFTERILDRIAEEPAWVPTLWTLECANVLATLDDALVRAARAAGHPVDTAPSG